MNLSQPAQSVWLGPFVYIVPVRVPRGYLLCLWVVMDLLPCIIKLQTGEHGQFGFSGFPDVRTLLSTGTCRMLCTEHQGVMVSKMTNVVCLTRLQSCV